jgi:hypothetical protein
VPKPSRSDIGTALLSGELWQRAVRLRQQSRFLHRQCARLRGRSNDLLTVSLFRQAQAHPRAAAGHRRLALLS